MAKSPDAGIVNKNKDEEPGKVKTRSRFSENEKFSHPDRGARKGARGSKGAGARKCRASTTEKP